MARNAAASALRSFRPAKSRLRRRRWTIQVARHVDRQRAFVGRPLRAHRERSAPAGRTGRRFCWERIESPGFLASVFRLLLSYSPVCIHVSHEQEIRRLGGPGELFSGDPISCLHSCNRQLDAQRALDDGFLEATDGCFELTVRDRTCRTNWSRMSWEPAPGV